jgi:hypothetical protein
MHDLLAAIGRLLTYRIHIPLICPRPRPPEPAQGTTDPVAELGQALFLMDPENAAPDQRQYLARGVAPLVADYLQDPQSVPDHLRPLVGSFITEHTSLQAPSAAPIPPPRGHVIDHAP